MVSPKKIVEFLTQICLWLTFVQFLLLHRSGYLQRGTDDCMFHYAPMYLSEVVLATNSPSASPTLPTPQPTTLSPVLKPSASPSRKPTQRPVTAKPTALPSRSPSRWPSWSPSVKPTLRPSSTKPSHLPSLSPLSRKPSSSPSRRPSHKPSSRPSKSPTRVCCFSAVCANVRHADARPVCYVKIVAHYTSNYPTNHIKANKKPHVAPY